MESPAIVPTASGRKSPISRVSAARATNSPLDVIDAKKSGPRPDPLVDTLTAIAMISGTAARMPSPAWLRRRPKISRSSERRNRVETCRRGRVTGATATLAARSGVRSAADIEALPSKGHEQVLKAGALQGKPRHGHPIVHHCHDDLLSGQLAQSAHRHA